ncbi:MAG TPA: aspartate-semialdehyde dehydrogenase [Candidatus Anammoximicrobium sp.]|nr:aspartate-semialdehyde dehydrogenase [Candidatus Anammoximicrobium sp.]
MNKLRVGVLGATGMVGQRFVHLLGNHPWFEVVAVAASPRSAGKPYAEAVAGRWAMPAEIPAEIAKLTVLDVQAIDAISQDVAFVFSALDMDKQAIRDLEDAYAKHECPVVSNNSAHRWTPDVPMIMPEINPEHLDIIEAQRRRLGTRRGFVVVKPNCSIQPYVPAFHALADYQATRAVVCTYQAVSGAGKTLVTWPEMVDNVIPYIGGEEDKSVREPLKIWGKISGGQIVPAESPVMSAQCIRVPVSDGHMAAVSVSFAKKPPIEVIRERWAAFAGKPQQLQLPSAPQPFLQYFEEDNRPQTKLDRDLGNGMAVALGRLREDNLFDYKFVALSHNTVRGAAGGAVLIAELLQAEGRLA